ncbi:Hypothetical predicted protein [Cloeon dipterum]|uniref:Uncharacterized protein n=1 Tax=Cloeon dipterum TaxID=197152 RepID=A0A8S1E9Q4_9INSE|nr:Hypothetical predicted protein [Cloeon dipterum]
MADNGNRSRPSHSDSIILFDLAKSLVYIMVDMIKEIPKTSEQQERLEMILNAYAAAAAPNRYEPNPCLSKAEFEAISEGKDATRKMKWDQKFIMFCINFRHLSTSKHTRRKRYIHEATVILKAKSDSKTEVRF